MALDVLAVTTTTITSQQPTSHMCIVLSHQATCLGLTFSDKILRARCSSRSCKVWYVLEQLRRRSTQQVSCKLIAYFILSESCWLCSKVMCQCSRKLCSIENIKSMVCSTNRTCVYPPQRPGRKQQPIPEYSPL